MCRSVAPISLPRVPDHGYSGLGTSPPEIVREKNSS